MNSQSRARMGLLLQALIRFFEFWVASKHIGADSVAQLLEGLKLLKHQHQAVEFYTPLSGTAVWQTGRRPPSRQEPGAFIFHQSNIPHAMETLAEPLLCLWAWVGELDRFPIVTSRSWL